jgi:MinD superfamily P-loop ATPase
MEPVQVNPELCDGCGDCMQVCAVDTIRIVNGKAVVGSDCIMCLACAAVCPRAAVIEPELPVRPIQIQLR